VLKRSLERLSGSKYRLFILGMLGGASLFSMALWRWRADITGSSRYGFLVWNLFLAWIPFLVGYLIYAVASRGNRLRWLIPAAAFIWLIFFPNAPYILTDFQHLNQPGWQDIDTWYDVLMLMWFAFTGLLLGIVSLFMMQEVIRWQFGRWTGWGFVALVTALTSLGVYMGRFLRWNSWDILHKPGELALLTLQHVESPSARSIVFTGIFGAFFLFLYLTLYAFGHLLQERARRALERSRSATSPVIHDP
jgi:uncharacterized membrane protein